MLVKESLILKVLLGHGFWGFWAQFLFDFKNSGLQVLTVSNKSMFAMRSILVHILNSVLYRLQCDDVRMKCTMPFDRQAASNYGTGTSILFREKSEEQVKKTRIKRSYLPHVGAIYPHLYLR